jgi:hypothetical protein
MSRRLNADKLQRRRLAYVRARLRQDSQPADPVVLDLFKRLRLYKSDLAWRAQREVWGDLLHYLTTLEERR